MIEAFAGRPIFQVAFVVPSLEDALERYSAALSPGPWRVYTLGGSDHDRSEYRGLPSDFSSRVALNDESPQLELIEPLDGPSTHRDWLDEHGEGLHHLGIVVDSVAQALEQSEAAGHAVVQVGHGLGPERDGAWAYVDALGDLGMLIEAVEPPSSMPPVNYVWGGG